VRLCGAGCENNSLGINNKGSDPMINNTFPIIEVLIGSGVISMLWQMNRKLGELANEMKRFSDLITDHEDRIRDLEGR
tara:strand:+ start:2682 stop:2915 length:234 start_codon:yes stop_codon:yes gene_type:complete